MPLIAGNKYSCEPCIRGHRATHCTHTDRLLIEVRKPGRPLDRCGHRIASCRCGRLGDAAVLQVSKTAVVNQEPQSVGSVSPVMHKSLTTREDEALRLREVKVGKPFTSDLDKKGREGTINGSGGSWGEENGLRVMISKDQPYGRELRLSPSLESGKSSKGERRKGKVYKRHRLGREMEGGSKSPEAGSGMDVDANVEMEGDEEDDQTPALSPSLSSSESESEMRISMSPVVGGKREIDRGVVVGVAGAKGEGRTRIAISELLS